jgi:hypothetical protein
MEWPLSVAESKEQQTWQQNINFNRNVFFLPSNYLKSKPNKMQFNKTIVSF